ncbi:MAG: class I SAM-dependent rRNA methyltransferase [Nitratiruptor sp.]|nr:class I SAM-dependent rRNA methyltransferase [Nitratiruptor sp.]NPA83930.1 class I SAM-dependent rRNA methyltransferase [Campylobacterota bacterium]
MKQVVITAKGARALEAFFPWVYRGEIVDDGGATPGSLVRLVDGRGRFLGIGYINQASTIAIRILTFQEEPIDSAFFARAITRAATRRRLIPSNAYRLLFSEADWLPGLIVDRYDDLLVAHFTTLGMVRFKELIHQLLQDLLAPRGIVLVGEERAAKREGFAPFVETFGDVGRRIIEEHGVRFFVDVLKAQKTGFYLDQRRNRAIVAQYLPEGGSMLDCFSNTGGFGLYGALKRKGIVRLVDQSAGALEMARENFALNEVKGEFVQANVFDYLRSIRDRELFDLVVLDPPSFAKSRRERPGALRGFKDLAINGIRVTKVNGFLALFSCSHHITMADLKELLRRASRDTRRPLVVLEELFQDHDHPMVLNIPNSHYLNGLLVQVLGGPGDSQ